MLGVVLIILGVIAMLSIVSYLYGKSRYNYNYDEHDRDSEKQITDLYLKKARDEIYSNPDHASNVHDAIELGKKLKSKRNDDGSKK